MSRKGSIAPAPATTVINIQSLQQALRPPTQGDESRSSTPRIVSLETQFLAEFSDLEFSHNFKAECCNCPCRTVVELRTGDQVLVMQSLQMMGCWNQQNIEVFNELTNELVILIEFVGGGCFGVPSTSKVYSPPGFLVGIVERATSCCSSSFEIQNANAETIYTVQPLLKWCGPTQFPIIAKDGSTKVAEVVTAVGLCSLRLNYFERLPAAIKALLIGFTLYLDVIESWKKATNGGV